MNWLQQNWIMVVDYLIAHLWLSIPPIIAASLIAIPIGRLAFRYPRVGGPILSGAALLYAVPALPLLVMIPAIFGVPLRSPITMMIALTLYGLSLMVRTALDAFNSVDYRVRQAAVALGNSPHSIFWKVDLPLAGPVLIAGIRVVAVSTIGLVPIGALIGIPSLGSLLTDGFQRGISQEIWVGVLSTMLLAMLIDLFLRMGASLLMPWTRRRKARA